MPRFRVLRIAERERIEARDRPRAHGEHIAQDAADAGRRALIRLDVARVVVALHLEHDREAVADGDHAGVLARPLDHVRAAGGQRPQMNLRGLVRAVLVPHRREDAELGDRRLAADQLQDALVLVGLEAVLGNQLGRDGRFVRNHVSVMPLARNGDQPGEQPAPVGAADRSFDMVLRMRHQAEHIELFVEHAGDRIDRAVDVPLRIALAVRRRCSGTARAPRASSRPMVPSLGEVVALAMRHRHADHLARHCSRA